MMQTALRVTLMTDEQRLALDQARRLLTPHFPGETLRLYVPRCSVQRKLEREARVREALLAGLAPLEVARREGVSRTYVYALRGRFA